MVQEHMIDTVSLLRYLKVYGNPQRWKSVQKMDI